MDQRRTNVGRHPFEVAASEKMKSNSVLTVNNFSRGGDFDYRGADYFNRNPSAKSNTLFRNYGRQYSHHGKGPKGYRRSDERIYDEIVDVLTEDAFVDATEVILHVTNGDIILEGTVDDKAQKRRAEDIVQEIRGVQNIENRIRVC